MQQETLVCLSAKLIVRCLSPIICNNLIHNYSMSQKKNKISREGSSTLERCVSPSLLCEVQYVGFGFVSKALCIIPINRF